MITNTEIDKNWIRISVFTLAVSGLYAIFIVLLRSKIFNFSLENDLFFKSSLVIHVDLSVLYWLVSVNFFFITKNINNRLNWIVSVIQKFLYISIFLVFITPIFFKPEPITNNYIPMLHNLSFIVGLGILFAAKVIISFLGMFFFKNMISFSLSLIINISILSFVISLMKIRMLSYPIDLKSYYEMIYWGNGHILQFLYTGGLIVAWNYIVTDKNLIISSEIRNEYKSIFNPSVLMLINAILVVPLPFIQLFIKIDSAEYLSLFTEHMKIFGGIIPSITFLIIVVTIFIQKSLKTDISLNNFWECKLRKISFYLSSLMFFAGGLIAITIQDSNTIIPAHYHGSIVGITIAFMGYVYTKLEELFSEINFKKAVMQIYLYFWGQAIHIFALAYAGGYGALRKAPGQELTINAKIAMGFVGIGGLLSIVSGLIFVYICMLSIYKNPQKYKL